jgi:ankyrin repeat protein
MLFNISVSRPSIKNDPINNNVDTTLREILEEKVTSLFSNNDITSFLRICRFFIKKSPQLLHDATNNNHSDLILKIIPSVSIELFQYKNSLGETVFFHAVRRNHFDVIKALLEKENSQKLLDDIIEDKKQNIFHVLAMNTNTDDILDLLIKHLLKNSINIQEKFDHADQDNHTPLQLAISHNNLSATRRLLKYSNDDVCETGDETGDNLVHLAVRFGDLTMLKYLIEEGKLVEQGNQSNLTMLPIELARAMKRDDMLEYLNEIYPQHETDEDESSEND